VADNCKPSEKRSPERIDGIVALIMAVGRAALQQGYTSAYDDPDFRPVFV
jgi:phage terminase large subunit-like protein